tara:strand:- start:907 stop:1131 length:225 start_codon:yes stop_codon:yes gene_type:complete
MSTNIQTAFQVGRVQAVIYGREFQRMSLTGPVLPAFPEQLVTPKVEHSRREDSFLKNPASLVDCALHHIVLPEE